VSNNCKNSNISVAVANASFASGSTNSGTTITATCNSGHVGNPMPTATCTNGNWSTSGSCVAGCPGAYYYKNDTGGYGMSTTSTNTNVAFFPDTVAPNGQVSGTCSNSNKKNKKISMPCNTGWDFGNVSGSCN
jgi:hypothetical protein